MAKDAWANVTSIFDKAKTIGSEIVNGIINGLGDLKDKMWEKANAAWEAVKDALSIFSPSKKAVEAGEQITAGMTGGLDGLADGVKQPFIDAWNYVKEIFSVANILEHFMGIVSAI